MQQYKQWKNECLENLSNIKKGKLTPQDDNRHIGWMKLLNTETLFSNIETFANTKNAVLATNKDILILCDGERSGLVAKGRCGVVGSTFAKISPNNQEVDTIYLYHYLNNKFMWIQNRRTGTGVPHIPKDLSRILHVKFPKDIKIQSRIANILTTCDDVIEKTEETIEKYKQIKSGMMQDLFTRGLDKNGKLRPKYEEAPDLYKYSRELDRFIPKEWELITLDDLSIMIKDGTHGTHKDVSNGIPLLSAKDIKDGKILIPNDCRKISKSDFDKIHANYKLEPSDLLLTIVGTIGRTAIVPDYNNSFTFQRSVAFIKLKNKDLSEYILSYLNFENTQKIFLSLMNASAQGGLYLGQLSSISVTVPINKKEFNNISKSIYQINEKIKYEQKYLSKYKQIKQGLMKRLLTPPADAEIVEE